MKGRAWQIRRGVDIALGNSLSVIVTVYNCDQYLQRCLESLMGQTYGEFEIVIVDDGSTDDSAKICDAFARKRDYVKVLHKVNGGTVSARKAGMEAASGEIVSFIDGDDWVDSKFCACLIQPFQENGGIDVVSSGLSFEYVRDAKKNYVLTDSVKPGLYTRAALRSRVLPNLVCDYERDSFAITTSICCKMLRKSVALEAMACMDEGLTFGEDGVYVLAVLLKAENVFVLDQAYYHYEQHEASQNYKYEMKSYEQLSRLQQSMVKIARDADMYQTLKLQIDYYMKTYLRKIAMCVYDINEDGRVYLFPADKVAPESRVLVHGAGKVGQQYIKYIARTQKYELVAWTDKNAEEQFIDIYIPCSIREITVMEYDYIILAAASDSVLEQMQEDVCKYNIPEEKIVAVKPFSYKI